MTDMDRIRQHVEFERDPNNSHKPCDSCWMLVELYDRLPDYEARLDEAENLIRSYVPEGSKLRAEWLAALRRLRPEVPA